MKKTVFLLTILLFSCILASCSEHPDETPTAVPETESFLAEPAPATPAPPEQPEPAPGAAEEIPVPEEAAEAEPDEPQLLFEDTFDGTELDVTKWQRCPEWDRQGSFCVWDDDMSYVDGEGNLVIRMEWDEDESRVRSGAVRTHGLFSAGYGYYEASIKFPYAPGTWGAFWMMAGNVASEDGSAADGVEIDIIESIGNDWGACNHALHWDGYGNAHKSVGSGELKNHGIYDGEFHTFGLLRSEEGYVFYIDGKESWKVSADKCDPCPEDGYLKLTCEAADWAGAGSAKSIKALPAEMLVDYVRVYSGPLTD